MKRFALSPDLALLKGPLLLLLLLILVGGVWVGGTRRFQEAAVGGRHAVERSRVEMAAQVRLLEEQQRAVRGYLEGYRRLQARGFMGEEQRLELVEALGRLRARYHLYALDFDVGQRVALPLADHAGPAWPEDAGVAMAAEGACGQPVLHASPITISLPLLHEEDLTRLLQGLQDLGQGLFVVQECEITQAQDSGGLGGEPLQVRENLSATCRLLWLTLNPADRMEPPSEAGI